MPDQSLAQSVLPESGEHPNDRFGGAPALSVRDLRRSYGSFEAVKGISFEIAHGEVFGLLGPNGAGKTTSISMLATAMRPSGGDATVLGHSISSERDPVRRVVGLVPQEISIYPALTAVENVRFFGRMYGVASSLLDDRVNTLLEMVGLTQRRDDRAETFSGGMKRRLNLAVSLVHQPRILLLDEPTAGVDPQSRQLIFEIVRNLREQGAAILYTTHYMEEAQALCDRLGVMDEGKIVAMGTLTELLTRLECSETVEIRGVPPQEIRARFGNHAAVSKIDVEGETSRLRVTDVKSILGALQQAFDHHSDLSLQISPMSLGDLFLHLTGKELRD